jgi:hypothetical protein
MADDVVYDRQLDQSMGDTCHHCKGDTWHGMTSVGDWEGTVTGGRAHGRYVDESTSDTW